VHDGLAEHCRFLPGLALDAPWRATEPELRREAGLVKPEEGLLEVAHGPDVGEALAWACNGGDDVCSALLELGRTVTARAEFWYAVAYVSAQLLADGEDSTILGVGGEAAANAAVDAFEDALRIFHAASGIGFVAETSHDYAETLLGYGKVILCFFDESDACDVERPLKVALKLHEDLLGHFHPRTCHVRKLCCHT